MGVIFIMLLPLRVCKCLDWVLDDAEWWLGLNKDQTQ